MTDVPNFSTHNGHIFYVIAENLQQRNFLIQALMHRGVDAHFHYPSLHLSDFHRQLNQSVPELPNSVRFSERLIRLPLYTALSSEEQTQVVAALEYALLEYKRAPNKFKI